VNKPFGSRLIDSSIGEIALLWHDSNVDDFTKCFMALSCRDMMITEAHQVQLFLVGLGKPLHTNVALHQLPTFDDAIVLARAYEQGEMVSSPSAPHQHSLWCA
jgi:hypothetical protein